MEIFDLRSLKGKKVFFLGQVFYDYHTKIVNELIALGAEVTFIPNKFHGEEKVSLFDFMGHLRKLIMPAAKKKYAAYILKEMEGEIYDYFFSISGFSITPNLMTVIKERNPNINTVLYFWDSFKTWNYTKLPELFDSVYSFDPEDASESKKINYLPLFYTEDYKSENNHIKDLDLIYIGSINFLSANRLKILKRVKDFAEKNNLKIYIWLYNSEAARSILGKMQSFVKRIFVKDFKKYHKSLKADDVNFLKEDVLNRTQIVELMKRSKCVIDIPIPKQLGLTIRTLETLALGCKLITTNQTIKDEIFYSPEFISLVEEDSLSLDVEFICKPQQGVPNIAHLELKNWLLFMFQPK